MVGPDRELSVNLFTVAVLGNPGTWSRAQAAADRLAAFAAGTDWVKPWQPLSPFIVTALHGYPLEFATLRRCGYPTSDTNRRLTTHPESSPRNDAGAFS